MQMGYCPVGQKTPRMQVPGSTGLLYMLVYHFGQFEHRDLFFASENCFQFCISIDVTLVLLVLEIVLLDVIPDLFDDLCSRKRLASYYFCQCSAGSKRSHEGCVRFSC